MLFPAGASLDGSCGRVRLIGWSYIPVPSTIAIDELQFFGGLAAITILVIGLLVFFGKKIANGAERNAEYIDLPLYVTRTGTALFAFVVAFWVCCATVRSLAPRSSFGEFLGTFDGVIAVASGSIMFVVIAWIIFDKLGYPLAKRDRDSESG